MNVKQKHIIQKVFLEVNINSVQKAHYIENNVNVFLQNELFPRLEELFDEYSLPNEIVRFDSLDIDISVDNWENTNAIIFEFGNHVENNLKINVDFRSNTTEVLDSFSEHKDLEKGQLQKRSGRNLNVPGLKQVSLLDSRQATFLFFIENGYLPWFGKPEYLNELAEVEIWNETFLNKNFPDSLNQLLFQSESAIERFVIQVPQENIFSFLQKISSDFAENKKRITQLLTGIANELKVFFLTFLIRLSVSTEISFWINSLEKFLLQFEKKKLNIEERTLFLAELKDVIVALLYGSKTEEVVFIKEKFKVFIERESNELLNENNAALPIKIIDKKEQKDKVLVHFESSTETTFFENRMNEITLKNAGLILLHPYFKSFFENLNWLAKNGEIKENCRTLAVQTLHYLATGTEDFWEFNLILEKWLCCVPLKMPIQKETLLTRVIKDETTVLLKETIKNWPALKNTSPDGLRQMFIHRDGKLIQKENNYKLIVERKAQDLLLAKLNWSISVIKLSWLEPLLFVEW